MEKEKNNINSMASRVLETRRYYEMKEQTKVENYQKKSSELTEKATKIEEKKDNSTDTILERNKIKIEYPQNFPPIRIKKNKEEKRIEKLNEERKILSDKNRQKIANYRKFYSSLELKKQKNITEKLKMLHSDLRTVGFDKISNLNKNKSVLLSVLPPLYNF